MDDQNTTTDGAVDDGATTALPDTTGQDSAEQPASDSATEDTSTGADSSAVPEEDAKLQKYADSHGITLDSDNAIKAAKIAMNNQAEFQRTRQQASKLEKSMMEQSDEYSEHVAAQTGESPEVLKRLNRMEIRDSIRDFWDSNPSARNHEDAIKQKILDSGISGNADSVLRAAYAMVQSDNQQSLKSEGGRQALQSLASKQRAAAPTGSAVNSGISQNRITRAVMREKLASGDTAWLEKNSAEINRLAAEGLLN